MNLTFKVVSVTQTSKNVPAKDEDGKPTTKQVDVVNLQLRGDNGTINLNGLDASDTSIPKCGATVTLPLA